MENQQRKTRTKPLSGPQCTVKIKNSSESRCTEIWIWFSDHNIMLFFLFSYWKLVVL